ncbi:hypothetical protein [Amycolatopsis sp. 195334CR]|uniref:tautomerase family protein n=1 Tax=Amycolatopsis sp. 195334CR TaxID=2814588 RepID=UPI001A8D6D94|nr:hypothetical protein [Amycolatopsis sp. 195334CR]MBN6038132.1 hypothetical protein [Amycolatopsis sp. 195334CR]
MPMIQLTAPGGLTDTDASRVWVLVHEQPEGTWGAGGALLRYADLVTPAQGARADA